MNLEVESIYLTVPGTGQQISAGTIVMLSRFPGMKWIVHYGWYTYSNQQCRGWYFNSIPANTKIPVTDEDLMMLTVISTNTNNSSGCNCYPGQSPSLSPVPKPPTPPGPGGHGLSPQQAFELNRSWISVDTIAMRDELSKGRLLPDGKVVRVNRATEDNKPKYYIWNQVTEKWDDFVIASSFTKIVEISQEDYDALTEEEKNNGTVYFIRDAESVSVENILPRPEADKLYASKDIEENLEQNVKDVVEEILPEMVSKEIDDYLEENPIDSSPNTWQSWPTT